MLSLTHTVIQSQKEQMDMSIMGKASGCFVTGKLDALKARVIPSYTAATSRFNRPELSCSTRLSDITLPIMLCRVLASNVSCAGLGSVE